MEPRRALQAEEADNAKALRGRTQAGWRKGREAKGEGETGEYRTRSWRVNKGPGQGATKFIVKTFPLMETEPTEGLSREVPPSDPFLKDHC